MRPDRFSDFFDRPEYELQFSDIFDEIVAYAKGTPINVVNLRVFPITYVDGMNDKWDRTPAHFAHL